MPRPQRELDPEGGPLVEFARALRELRAAAGTPKFAAMSRRTGRSKTALADAAGGRHLPRWETVEDFVRACEADPAGWRRRWEAARVATAAIPGGGPGPAVADDSRDVGSLIEDSRTEGSRDDAGPIGDAPDAAPSPPAPTPTSSPLPPPPVPVPVPRAPSAPVGAAPGPPTPRAPASPRRWRGKVRGRVVGVGVALGLLLAAAGVGAAVGVATGSADDRPPVVTQALRVIEVQNKVAIGPDALVEDSTPAYLSSVPIAYCASVGRNCKVPGTEMASGAALVANCQVQGQRMVNFDLAEVASRGNSHRADSSLWYRATFPDGRTGYLSEVYVNGENRGGLGLPTCGPFPASPGVAQAVSGR